MEACARTSRNACSVRLCNKKPTLCIYYNDLCFVVISGSHIGNTVSLRIYFWYFCLHYKIVRCTNDLQLLILSTNTWYGDIKVRNRLQLRNCKCIRWWQSKVQYRVTLSTFTYTTNITGTSIKSPNRFSICHVPTQPLTV